VERPSALEICKFLAPLKKNGDYSESVRLADDTARQEHDIQKLRERQEKEIQQFEREKAREIEELERQLEELKTKKSKAQERVKELESQLWKQ
jgi:chromosome segregation ATPase